MEMQSTYQTKQAVKPLLNDYKEVSRDIGKLLELIKRYTDVSKKEIAQKLMNNFERNFSYHKIKQFATSIMSKLLKLFSKIDDFWVSMDVRLVGKCVHEIMESVDKFYLGMSALKPINVSYTMTKMVESHISYKEDSRRSLKFLKEVTKRLKSALPECALRKWTDVEKLTNECKNLFDISKLRYGRKLERLNTASTVSQKGFISSSSKQSHSFAKHRSILKKPYVSMHKIALLKEARNCHKQSFNSMKTSKSDRTSASDKSRETSAVLIPETEISKLVNCCEIVQNVSKKRKQMDEINQPTEGVTHSTEIHSEKKMKIEKKKITVAEYFARKRHENEMKKCPVNENAKKRKRDLSENYGRSDSKNYSNALARVLDVFCFNTPKKAKLSSACQW
eukprot:Seg1330.3 transcript_id=Seg1330.3/GoldUCD/mRNA.D3Y31 product="hypothetical protein" protein_id=Seg1330.3/GoldUCD/D3Y31